MNKDKKGKKPAKKEEPKKKESILDLHKLKDKKIIVKYQGGREVVGKLIGYDNLQNLVLDDCVDRDDRNLGLVVCRGTAIILISPFEGTHQIDNPF